jgi:hypothetical protein
MYFRRQRQQQQHRFAVMYCLHDGRSIIFVQSSASQNTYSPCMTFSLSGCFIHVVAVVACNWT